MINLLKTRIEEPSLDGFFCFQSAAFIWISALIYLVIVQGHLDNLFFSSLDKKFVVFQV